MKQEQSSSTPNKTKNIIKKSITWTKLIIYLIIGFIIFYIIYSVIVSIIRFLSPIFKTLSKFFGSGDASNPGISGAPWWAWFGMAWYLLPAGALGIGASSLFKAIEFHNPDLSKKDIAELCGMTEEELMKERNLPENKDLSENEFAKKMIKKAGKIASDAQTEKANELKAKAETETDQEEKAKLEDQAKKAEDAAKDIDNKTEETIGE